jgi:molecular chaperone GrpE (heat shock protein)
VSPQQVTLTRAPPQSQLQRVLEKYGVVRYDPMGQKFNPNEHSALLEVDSGEHASGHVALVMKRGYRSCVCCVVALARVFDVSTCFVVKDRILRVADVGVTRSNE